MLSSQWQRSVLVQPKSDKWWMTSHTGAACLKWQDEIGSIIIGGRAQDNRSRLGYMEVVLEANALALCSISEEPLLDVGPLGSFYQDGVSYPWRFQQGNVKSLLFTGWRRTDSGFENHLGLASWDDNENAWVPDPRPIFPDEQFGTGSACYFEDQNGPGLLVTRFSGWFTSRQRSIPRYAVWIARLASDQLWELREPLKGISVSSRQAVARPAVVRTHGETLLWLSLREENSYRLIGGRLEGQAFIRDPSLDIAPAPANGWDSQMTEYAAPAIALERLVVLYNGNGFGKTGLGVAIK